METLLSDFTKELMYAMEITEHINLPPRLNQLMNVVIHGTGASGIAANMAADVIGPEAKIPIIVNKNHYLPQFVSGNTLVIICSYSGETEESIMVLQDAAEKGAYVICITPVGTLQRLAIRVKLDVIQIPLAVPAGAVTGFLFIQLLYIFNFYGILSDLYNRDLTRAIELINADENKIIHDAKKTAEILAGKYINIYGASGMESVGLRFRQQLIEHAKCFCSYNVFPDLSYNELQGWGEQNDNFSVVIFRNHTSYRITSRLKVETEEILSRSAAEITEVYPKGNSILENILYQIHWGDWVSCYLAKRNGIERRDIKTMAYLKPEFANMEAFQ